MTVHCPFEGCGGVLNKLWFSHIETDLETDERFAVFMAQCWSGDTHKPSNYHIFELWYKLPVEPVLMQSDLKEEEAD